MKKLLWDKACIWEHPDLRILRKFCIPEYQEKIIPYDQCGECEEVAAHVFLADDDKIGEKSEIPRYFPMNIDKGDTWKFACKQVEVIFLSLYKRLKYKPLGIHVKTDCN